MGVTMSANASVTKRSDLTIRLTEEQEQKLIDEKRFSLKHGFHSIQLQGAQQFPCNLQFGRTTSAKFKEKRNKSPPPHSLGPIKIIYSGAAHTTVGSL